MKIKLETCKGDFTGNIHQCAEWLAEMQPTFVSVVLADGRSAALANFDLWSVGDYLEAIGDSIDAIKESAKNRSRS